MSTVIRTCRFCLLSLCTAVPFLLLIGRIAQWNVDVPSRDLLGYVSMLESFIVQHRIPWEAFLIPRSEHLIPVSIFLWVVPGGLVRWNMTIMTTFIASLALLNGFFLMRMSGDLRKHMSTLHAVVLTLFVFLLLFSFTQWESWSGNVTVVSAFLSQAFFLAAVTLLMKPRRRAVDIVLAGLCCALSSFSMPNGILSWIATFPLLLSGRPATDTRKMPLAFWMWWLALGLTILAHKRAFANIAVIQEDYFYLFHNPLDTVRNFLTIIGAPLLPTPELRFYTFFIGAALFCMGIVACANILRSRHAMSVHALPWASLFLFATGSCAFIALGRSSSGAWSAFVSRYLSTTQYAGIAVLFLAYVCWPRMRRIVAGVAAVLCVTTVFFSARALPQWQERSILFSQAKACLETYTLSSDTCLSKLYPWTIPSSTYVRSSAPILEKMGVLRVLPTPRQLPLLRQEQHIGKIEDISPVGPTFEMLVESGALNVRGWVHTDGKKPIPDIWLTTGTGGNFIAHTVPVIPHANINGMTVRGWSVEILPLRGSGSVTIEAWMEDKTRHALVKLDNTLTVDVLP